MADPILKSFGGDRPPRRRSYSGTAFSDACRASYSRPRGLGLGGMPESRITSYRSHTTPVGAVGGREDSGSCETPLRAS